MAISEASAGTDRTGMVGILVADLVVLIIAIVPASVLRPLSALTDSSLVQGGVLAGLAAVALAVGVLGLRRASGLHGALKVTAAVGAVVSLLSGALLTLFATLRLAM